MNLVDLGYKIFFGGIAILFLCLISFAIFSSIRFLVSITIDKNKEKRKQKDRIKIDNFIKNLDISEGIELLNNNWEGNLKEATEEVKKYKQALAGEMHSVYLKKNLVTFSHIKKEKISKLLKILK